jgi:glycosyltransferase involved in cell wall biosynthesis
LEISIIIPLYNRAKLIGATLDSVKAQTFERWECIVVDDGSTDKSQEVVKSYCQEDARFQLRSRPPERPKGANTCRNYGLELARGDFICFLDSDDLFCPDKLEFQLQVLNSSNESAVASITQAVNFVGAGEEIGLWKAFEDMGKWPTDVVLKNLSWSPAAPLWRKSCLNERPFSEGLAAGQDYEFHVKQAMSYSREQFIFHDKISVKVRTDNPSIGRSKGINKHLGYLNSRLNIVHFMLKRKITNKTIQQYLLTYAEEKLTFLFLKSKISVLRDCIFSYLSIYWKINKSKAIKKTIVIIMIALTGKGHRFLIN